MRLSRALRRSAAAAAGEAHVYACGCSRKDIGGERLSEHQRVTLVVRGADLLSSPGRQICLARMLGRAEPPVFLHHPLILKASGEKLSKSSGDTGVRELRAAGVRAADVIGRAAAAVGLLASARPVTAEEVAQLFSSRSL